MTEEQVTKWREQRDKAKQIEDPEAREKALDIVYDMKDDLQLDCQRKMADRIKKLVANDEVQAVEISGIKTSVTDIKAKMEEHDPIIKEVQQTKWQIKGGWNLLRIIGWLATVGGSGAVGWIIAMAKKAAEQQ